MKNQALTIGNTQVRQTESGLYCLNDLHKASGKGEHLRPSYFLRADQTIGMIDSLNVRQAHNCVVKGVRGASGGTYVCKELVYAYAMWISPDFSIDVIQAFDAIAQGNEKQALAMAGTQAAADRLALLDDELVKEYISIRKRELRQLENQAEQLRQSLAGMDIEASDIVDERVNCVIELLGRRKKSGRKWLIAAELKDGVKNLKVFKGQTKMSSYIMEEIMPHVVATGVASVDGKRININ